MDRPLGITLLSVLQVGGGTILILSAISVLASPFIDAGGIDIGLTSSIMLSSILISMAAINYVISYGLYHGMQWAWYMEILYVASIILNILFISTAAPINIVLTLIPLSILIYLYSDGVKRYFLGGLDTDFYQDNANNH